MDGNAGTATPEPSPAFRCALPTAESRAAASRYKGIIAASCMAVLCFVALSSPAAAATAPGTTSESVLAATDSLRKSGRLEEAAARLKEAMSGSPAAADIRTAYAVVLLELGRAEAAERELLATSTVAGDEARVRLLLAVALDMQGKRMEAAEQFRNAVTTARSPDEAMTAHLALAAIYEDAGDSARANTHYTAALALEPQLRGALVNVQKELLLKGATSGRVGNNKDGAQNIRLRNVEAEVERLRKNTQEK